MHQDPDVLGHPAVLGAGTFEIKETCALLLVVPMQRPESSPDLWFTQFFLSPFQNGYDPQGPIRSTPQRERKQNVLNTTGVSEEKSSWFIELERW